jgi:putative transposase
MSNHFHLLIRFRDPRQLSACLAGLLRAYVHYYNRQYGFVGHLWQGRFKSPAVEMESYLLSCGRYIERNPLAAGIVSAPWDYAWSSCRAYALGERDELLTVDPYYEELGAEPAIRQERWREFLLAEDPKEEVVRRQDWLVGDTDFRRRTREWRGRPLERTGRPAQAEAGDVLPQTTCE